MHRDHKNSSDPRQPAACHAAHDSDSETLIPLQPGLGSHAAEEHCVFEVCVDTRHDTRHGISHDTTHHRLLDSQFHLHSAFGDAWFFERIARAYESSDSALGSVHPASTRALNIHVHHASAAELLDAAADWPGHARFHRSLNYPQWNLEGPADSGAILLPGEGMLFRHDARRSCLHVHIDPMRAVRSSELIFHAARNLALWRRGPRFAPMLHASAVVFDGETWLFLGGKGAGKSTLFIDAVLRHGARPLANDRVMLDAHDGCSVWSWPSYLSYCEGTIVDYPELRRIFDAGLRDLQQRYLGGHACDRALYRRSYLQQHKRIVAPCLLAEVLGVSYVPRAPLSGVVRATLVPGHGAGATLHAVRSTASLRLDDIADALFPADDPDFPCWHGDADGLAQRPDPAAATLGWLRRADLPYLEVTLDPVCGKHGLRKLLDR